MLGEIGAWRTAALVAVGWIGMSLVASLQAVVPMRVLPGLKPGPDVVMLVVLFVGLSGRGGPAGVGALAVLLGYLSDLSSGAPKGTHMLAFLCLALLSRAASSRLMVRGALFTALTAGFFAALFHLGLALLRAAAASGTDITSHGLGGWGPLKRVPWVVLSTALFAPLVFALLARIDLLFGRFSGRDPRALSPVR